VKRWLEKFNFICVLNNWDNKATISTILGVFLHKPVYNEISELVSPKTIADLELDSLKEAMLKHC